MWVLGGQPDPYIQPEPTGGPAGWIVLAVIVIAILWGVLSAGRDRD